MIFFIFGKLDIIMLLYFFSEWMRLHVHEHEY